MVCTCIRLYGTYRMAIIAAYQFVITIIFAQQRIVHTILCENEVFFCACLHISTQTTTKKTEAAR